MIRVISSQQYETCSLAGGQVVIDAPFSRLDGSVWAHEQAAGEAIEREQTATKQAVDQDLAQGGALMRGLALFAWQLQLLGWDELELEIDLASRIVIFPEDQMLSIRDAHEFLKSLIDSQLEIDPARHAHCLDNFQQSKFVSAAR